jgi:hypothetical protein
MPRPLAIEILDAIASTYRGHRAHVEGPTEDRSFDVGEVSRLDIAGPFDVAVRTGSPPVLSASGPGRALDHISVEQDDDRLFIGCNGECDDVSITVTLPHLAAIRTSGSGGVSVDRVDGDLFEFASSGSGDLSLDEADVQQLKLSASGSGDIRVDKLRAGDVEAALMGSGDLSLDAVEGSVFRLSMNGSGDAHIEE